MSWLALLLTTFVFLGVRLRHDRMGSMHVGILVSSAVVLSFVFLQQLGH